MARAKEELLARMEKAANEAEKTLSSSLASTYINNFLRESPIMGAKLSYIQAKKLMETINVAEISNLAKQ